MRLTTKIIIGIISTIFLINMILIIGLSFTERKERHQPLIEGNRIVSSENKVEMDLESFKTVLFDYKYPIDEYKLVWEGILSIKSPQQEGINKLILPREMREFMQLSFSNDTLRIIFDNSAMKKVYYPKEERQYVTRRVLEANMQLQTKNVDIISEMGSNFEIQVKKIKTDHMKINAANTTRIHSCEATSISPLNQKKFRLKDCVVKELNIDQDSIDSWRIDKGTLEVLNITGKGESSFKLEEKVIKTINWNPKDKDSRLIVTLSGDSARIVLPK